MKLPSLWALLMPVAGATRDRKWQSDIRSKAACARTRWEPGRLIITMLFVPAPSMDGVLARLARRNNGRPGARTVLEAWDHSRDGIRPLPHPDSVPRIAGPLQDGLRHPFLLDPEIGSFGCCRSWRNDLNWTKPWRHSIATLAQIRRSPVEPYRETSSAAWRLARRMEKIPLAGRANALKILPVLEQDSRLGYVSEGRGVFRGGLFTSELTRELPALAGRAPAVVPTSLRGVAAAGGAR